MIRLLSSMDPALSPLEQEVTWDPRTLPDDEQRLLEATLDGAPDAILAGFEEKLTERRP